MPAPRRGLCPSCSRIAVKEVLTRDDSIREATYSCERGHLFSMRWLVTA